MGRWSVLGMAVAAGLLVIMGLTSCGRGDSAEDPLSYSVFSLQGHMAAEVQDNRTGRHTVWVVLSNPPAGFERELLRVHNRGNGSLSGASHGPVSPGTYYYAVYSVDGLVDGDGGPYWTQENRVGAGQVTVP
jgi:hypothetical protein